MQLRWTPEAAANLNSISEYLQEQAPVFRQSTIRRIYEAALSLRSFPEIGRVGAYPGTRELVIQGLPYLIVYRLANQVVELLHIYHGAQNRNP